MTSRDSDAFGPVPLALVLGKATKRFPGVCFWKATDLSHDVDVSCFLYSSDTALQRDLDADLVPLPAVTDEGTEDAVAVLEEQEKEDGRKLAAIMS